MRNKRFAAAAVLTVAALSLAGCAGGSGDESEDSVIEWWHVQTVEPSKTTWQEAADAFEAENPGVTIKITAQDADSYKTALKARLQAGDPPDIFQSWGGGILGDQVKSGMVKDVTEQVEPWIDGLSEGAVSVGQVDGKQYAIPYNAGLTGFWYNKAMFAEAGVDVPPATWDEFIDAVEKLKASGVTPIALGEGDKWPGMAYWEATALRAGGPDVFAEAEETADFSDPAFLTAGEAIQELVDADAFQEGFLGAQYSVPGGQAALVANGQAAMELMGQWAGGTQASVAENGVGLGEDLGWFEFPLVDGGAGGFEHGFGGVDAFAVGKDAPDEAVDFLEYIAGSEVQTKIGEDGLLLPVALDASSSVADPILRQILEALGEKKTITIWLDQLYSPQLATGVLDNVQALFAKTATPEQAADAIAASAQ